MATISAVGIFATTYALYGTLAGWAGLGVDARAVAVALALFALAIIWRRGRAWLAPLRFVGEISYVEGPVTRRERTPSDD